MALGGFKKTIISVVIITVSVAVFVYWKNTMPIPKKTVVKEKFMSVNALTIHQQKLSPELTLYGTVESPFNSTISSVIVADVEELLALEGQQVKRGQVLIKLDPKDVGLLVKQRQAELNHVKVSLVNNKKELARQELLFAKKVISLSAIDKLRQTVLGLEADLNRTQAVLDQIKNNQRRSQVLAPFSGRITKVFVSPGDRVNVGAKLVSLYAIKNLEVRTQLPNNMLSKFRALWSQGKKISATINSNTLATLSRITGEVKNNAAGIDALFRIDQEDNSLSLGRAVKLTVKLPAQDNTAFLPYEAFYNQDNIYLINNSRLKLVTVTRLGQFTSNNIAYVLIDASNLPANAVVMLTQLPNAISGLKVNIVTLDGKTVSVTLNTSIDK